MTADKIILKSKNWEQFEYFIGRENNKMKGDVFERLVQIYLKLDPTHASKLSEVWHLSDVPPSVKNYIHLRSQDQGVDLVAKTKSGKYWAIQCKYRDNYT